MKEITSPSNPFIKSLVVLRDKSKERRTQGKFIIEGLREMEHAIRAGYTMESLLICNDILAPNQVKALENIPTKELILISSVVFNKLALRATTEGIIAVAQTKDHNLSGLHFESNSPLILIAEAPEKPGNIGALLRTADAAGVDAVIIANHKTDLYNPNIVRSSVGCVFTNQIAMGSTTEILEFLKEKDIAIYAAILQEAEVYTNPDYTQPTAIVVGTEDAGLSHIWREEATKCVKIPMQGVIDSMNVSVAAGILIFEAVRQRQSN